MISIEETAESGKMIGNYPGEKDKIKIRKFCN
jgi:hypothetical protein